MASILQKAKQQKAKKAPAATNLNDLNKAVAFEDKTNVPIQTAAKKQDDDWGTEQHEAIEIQQIKTEKKEEEEVQPKEAVQQQKVENVTWGATKEMDEQEGFLIAAAQAQASQGEVEDPNKGKKVMKSWVPQLREDGGNASSTFEEEKEYFPEMGVDILTKKVEKPKPTLISRAEGSSSSGTASSNPPRFSGGAKGGFKPLEMTEQQKKLLEISENNKKEYSNPPQNQNGEFGGPRGVEGYGKSEDSYGSRAYNNNDGFGIGRNTNTTTSTPAALPGSELFGASSATQPPRFTSKKATEGGNFVAIQKSEQDIKQEEAQKRIEEMLKEKRENAAKNVEEEDKFEMRRNVEKKTESASNVESQQIARGEEPSVAKPPPRFVNANKTAATGPKFKDIEVKEEKLPGGLEEKKYLQKKEAPKEEDKQQQQQQDNNNTKQEDDGFKMVRA